jgi:hypothetical protein
VNLDAEDQIEEEKKESSDKEDVDENEEAEI